MAGSGRDDAGTPRGSAGTARRSAGTGPGAGPGPGAGSTEPDGRADDAAAGGRRRGRRRAAPGDTRAGILAAATAEFAAHGYDGVSLRAVARRAGVDPALVHHYFDDKAALFSASIGAPIRPDRVLAEVLHGPRDRVGENLVRILLGTLDSEPAQSRVLGIIATALRQPFAAGILRQFLVREVLHQVAREFDDGADGELRATLAASQIVGLIVARYGLRVEPLASTPADQLVHRVGPVIQWHLSGDASAFTAAPPPS